MARIYLVRHGKAKGEWATERDPGLDPVGREQAKAAARSLAPLGPLKIVSSPYARTRETSMPLAEIWNVTPTVDERIGEIPSPVEDLADRLRWFQKVMALRWLDVDANLKAWRRGVIEALHECEEDTVLFSHAIAINVVVGEATGDDRVVCFWPENSSITTVDATQSVLRVIHRGVEDAHKDWKNIKV
ncbi:MAG: histidine phosphatase family protein [Deltaproteobacteria bacterium]|jgi:broad specificity phosphatase PhoE|nr:histidine phosphatase family protein [Deltaproteobacteria bacterium]